MEKRNVLPGLRNNTMARFSENRKHRICWRNVEEQYISREKVVRKIKPMGLGKILSSLHTVNHREQVRESP